MLAELVATEVAQAQLPEAGTAEVMQEKQLMITGQYFLAEELQT